MTQQEQRQQAKAQRALGHTRADIIWHLLRDHGVKTDKPWPHYRVMVKRHEEAHALERAAREADLAQWRARRELMREPVYCPGSCGEIGWTRVMGRVCHKHNCPHRTDSFCQTHPKGCPKEQERG